MAGIQSPEELKDYAFRALGAPVINIEVADEQAYDRIDDALQKFNSRHYAGAIERWALVTIKQRDLDRGYVTLPDDWVSLLELLEPDAGMSGEEFENINFRLANSDYFSTMFGTGTRSGMGSDLASWQIFHEKIDMFNMFFNPQRRFRFNHLTHRLEAQGSWRLGSIFVAHGYQKVDAEEHVDVYNEEFIKKYVIALIGRQWGSNLMKFTGVQLAGGVQLDGKTIFDIHDAHVKEIDESFAMQYEEPLDFYLS